LFTNCLPSFDWSPQQTERGVSAWAYACGNASGGDAADTSNGGDHSGGSGGGGGGGVFKELTLIPSGCWFDRRPPELAKPLDVADGQSLSDAMANKALKS
jgi:hypothetical protein